MSRFSFVAEIVATDKVEVAFKDLDAAILVGSMPRKEGMQRKDLLKSNVAIFQTQGAALDKYAKKTVKVVTPGLLSLCLFERLYQMKDTYCDTFRFWWSETQQTPTV